MEELLDICEKFKDGKCSLEELYRRLSWIAVPDEYMELVAEAEKKLELVQFTCLEDSWYKEASAIIDSLLKGIV